MWFLALRKLDLLARRLLVGNPAEQVGDQVQASPLLVVGADHVPRGEARVGRGKHLVARARVVVPAAVRPEVHACQLPELAAIFDAVLQAARLKPLCQILLITMRLVNWLWNVW